MKDDSSISRPQRSEEEIAARNASLESAWQERLQQMGHGPNSGSQYAKIRFGKGKAREVDTDTSLE